MMPGSCEVTRECVASSPAETGCTSASIVLTIGWSKASEVTVAVSVTGVAPPQEGRLTTVV